MKHKFVEFIPAEPEEGIIYISMEYATVTHLCPCGCRSKVITPITPIDWQLIFNGESVSLNPSVGNWRFPCRSHYFIKQNQVIWAGDYTEDQVRITHENERKKHQQYHSQNDKSDTGKKNASFFSRIFKSIFS